ncbi:glutamic acid-rich protein-like [Xenopus tropicalis]|uniref:Glutamic acid-rich protein-like n=1 Tax=Xenopus tropicalis TaxID=8364 RepID=A0A8J1JVA0_XENTR|nr:glutamic acid-rich protein-like [Xenopus tropicalis]
MGEDVTKGKKRKKKKKNPVKKPVETIMNEVKSDDVSIKPGPSEEQMQSEERPSEVKKDEIYPEQECVVPDHVSATEEECMVPDEVCAESEIQRGTSPKPKFKRLTILQWIDQDDDDEEDNDEDETNLEQTLQAPEKKMVPLTESQKETSVILDMALEQIPLKPSAEAPTETTLPETSISSPQQDMEAQEEPPMVSKAKL